MKMEIGFPGGLAVEASFRGHTVRTDQPEKAGGEDSGPAPFDLYLASMATCMGYYALEFCRRRDLGTDGMRLTLEPHRHPETRRLERLEIRFHPPEGFPEKYRPAVLRSMDQCAVKRQIVDPPEFDVDFAR